jgi:hypothetical protein
MTTPFENRLVERLRQFIFDGTECHAVVDSELHGLELEHSAAAIRHKIVSQYQGTVPLDAVLMILLESEEGI